MERSHSCTSFDLSGNMANQQQQQHSSIINMNSLCSRNMRKAQELQHLRMQQQQQQQQQQLRHAGSSDSIMSVFNAAAAMQQQQQQQHLPFFASSNNAAMRHKKKCLQRQQSTDYADEMDYAADLDEEEEEYDETETAVADVKPNTNSILTNYDAQNQQKNQKQKQLQLYRQNATTAAHFLLNTICNQSNLPIHAATVAAHCTSPASSVASSCGSSSISLERRQRLKHEQSFDFSPSILNNNASNSSVNDTVSPLTGRRQNFGIGRLMRDNSIHSDSSRYSSVDSLLEARKPDPEAILINLGFGPVDSEDILSRIPKRFLKPSQVRGIDTEAFVKRLQLANNLADHSALGYRGLTGNPDVPPSTIVAKIMQRFEVNERKKSMGSAEHAIR